MGNSRKSIISRYYLYFEKTIFCRTWRKSLQLKILNCGGFLRHTSWEDGFLLFLATWNFFFLSSHEKKFFQLHRGGFFHGTMRIFLSFLGGNFGVWCTYKRSDSWSINSICPKSQKNENTEFHWKSCNFVTHQKLLRFNSSYLNFC